MKLFSSFVALLFVVAVAWYFRNSRVMTETPKYTVVRTDGSFEIREYPPLTLVVTPMKPGGSNESFGHLFKFITGKNATSEKLPMTTPVLIDTTSGKETMGFIVPKAFVKKGVPPPSDPELRLAKLEAGRYGVLRFEGTNSAENERLALGKLQTWLKDQNLAAVGDPLFAYFDPPWTPVFLRRNEVMIRVQAPAP